MGSFDYTCAVSGLPIGGGMKVRYLLLTQNPYNESKAHQAVGIHDWWFPRTYPLRAEYNDYGGVENVEDGPARDIWLEGLALDLVPQGWGDNSVHDVPTSASMTFEELLEAVREARVQVCGDTGLSTEERRESMKLKVPDGVPTLERVQEQLTKNKLALYKANGKDGYLVDLVEYGAVRVRWHGGGKNYGKDVQFLEKAKKHLGDYVTVIKAGTGAYAFAADLLVYVKVGTKDFRGDRKEEKKSLLVSHAMIREDVWQALLKLRVRDDNKLKLSAYREGVRKQYDKIARLTNFPRIEAGKKTSKELVSELRSLMAFDPEDRFAAITGRGAVPFTVGIDTHWNLFLKKKPPAKQLDAFLESVAELAYVQHVLMGVRYWWRPSTSVGAQFGEPQKHVAFFRALAEVANKQVKAEKAEEG